MILLTNREIEYNRTKKCIWNSLCAFVKCSVRYSITDLILNTDSTSVHSSVHSSVWLLLKMKYK